MHSDVFSYKIGELRISELFVTQRATYTKTRDQAGPCQYIPGLCTKRYSVFFGHMQYYST